MKKFISIISILILFCLLFSYSTPATYAYSNQSEDHENEGGIFD